MPSDHIDERQAGHAAPHGADRARPEAGDEAMDIIATMEAQLAQVKRMRAEHDRAASELLSREKELAQRAAELQQSESKLSQEHSTISEQRTALERQRAAFGEETERVKRLQDELESRAESLRQKEGELDEATRSLDAAIKHASERAASLAKDREFFEAERTKAQAIVAERERALAAMKSELEAAKKALAAERAGASKRAGDDAAKLGAADKTLSDERERAAALDESLAETQGRLDSAMKALAERDRSIASLSAEAKSASSGAGEQAAALRAQLDRKEAALANAEKQHKAAAEGLAEAQRRIAALETELKNAPAGGAAESDSEVVAELEKEIEKRDRAIGALKQRLDEAKTEISSFRKRVEEIESQADAGRGGAPALAGEPGWLESRRKRLRRYKLLLRDQSGKILQARAALAKRQEQYEALLQKRIELAEAKNALERVSARVEKNAGRNKVAVAMTLIVMSVAALGALSWAVAERVFPGTFLAQAAVTASGDGTDLSREQLDSWGQYVKDLANDPRMMEVAAERMKRRGILDLANPSDLSSRLGADLDVAVLEPGAVSVNLRGQGSERTGRILDTFLAALVVVANDARERRMDQATTAVSQAPTVGDEPIDRPAIVYAGMIWGASSTILLGGGLIAWVRLARASRRLEELEPALDGLDEDRWPASPQAG